MKVLGFQKTLTFLLGTAMAIKAFISHRHGPIAKWMREDCPRICRDLGKPVVQPYFDIWHIGKSNNHTSPCNVYIYNEETETTYVTLDHWDTLQHLMVPIVCAIIAPVLEMLHCNLNWHLLLPSILQCNIPQ